MSAIPLTDGWSAAAMAPGSPGAGGERRRPAVDRRARARHGRRCPARRGPLRSAGRNLDAEDWWFRTSFAAGAAAAGEEVVLCLDGIATVAEVT